MCAANSRHQAWRPEFRESGLLQYRNRNGPHGGFADIGGPHSLGQSPCMVVPALCRRAFPAADSVASVPGDQPGTAEWLTVRLGKEGCVRSSAGPPPAGLHRAAAPSIRTRWFAASAT